MKVSNPTPDPNPSRAHSSVAKGEGDHAVRHAGKDPQGKIERAARVIETHQLLARKTERLGGLRTHERGVVPGELRQGIGKLLQPPVVRETAVVKRRGGEEDDLQVTREIRTRLARRSASGAKAAELRERRPL